MKTINWKFKKKECIDSYYADGYEDCKKDVLGLLKTNKTKEQIIKEIEG